jgi:hypothetical protein
MVRIHITKEGVVFGEPKKEKEFKSDIQKSKSKGKK